MVRLAEGENVYIVPGFFKIAFVQVDIVGDTANVGFVSICHHANAHGSAFLSFLGFVLKEAEFGV
jgi:hypothetical protein